MRLLPLIFIILTTLTSTAQNKIDSKFEFQKVIKAKLSTEELFKASNLFLAKKFHNQKDVIRILDSTRIFAKGSIKYFSNKIKFGKLNGWVSFEIQFDLKEQKSRITCSGFKHEAKSKNNFYIDYLTDAEEYPYNNKGLSNNTIKRNNQKWVEIKRWTQHKIDELIAEYELFIKEQSEDNW